MNKLIELLVWGALGLGITLLDAALRKPNARASAKLNEALIAMRKGAKKQ